MASELSLDAHVPVLEPLVHLGEHEVDDLDDVFLGELVEDDRVVDTVEEFRPEVLLELFVDLDLHPLVVRLDVALGGEAQVEALRDVPGPEVGRHDDDRVLEVHDPALGVGQATVLQNLEQGIEDIGVGLLDLVEEDDGERLAAHLLGELAALFVPHVTGGEPKRRETVCFSLNSDMSREISASSSPKRNSASVLESLRLTDTGRTGEDERATGALRVLETGSRTADRLREGLDGVLLPDDALVEPRPPCAADGRTPPPSA